MGNASLPLRQKGSDPDGNGSAALKTVSASLLYPWSTR